MLKLDLDAQWQQNGTIVAGENGFGNGIHELSYPSGLYNDDDQTIYIAEQTNDRVLTRKLDVIGNQVIASGNESLSRIYRAFNPYDVIIDKARDSLIVSTGGYDGVVQLDLRNERKRKTIIPNVISYGLTMDDRGFLYVVDNDKAIVRRYGRGISGGLVVAGGNGNGDRTDQFQYPTFVFVDRDYSIYVSDSGNNRVMKWMRGSVNGIIVAGGRGKGNSFAHLSFPGRIAVDQMGTLYVADAGNSRIMRWSKGASEGYVIIGSALPESLLTGLLSPLGISFDKQRNIYIVDNKRHQVQRFNFIDKKN